MIGVRMYVHACEVKFQMVKSIVPFIDSKSKAEREFHVKNKNFTNSHTHIQTLGRATRLNRDRNNSGIAAKQAFKPQQKLDFWKMIMTRN